MSEPVTELVPRTLCNLCGFVVNPVGHAERCRTPEDPSVKDEFLARAWLGDSWHRTDVRLFILCQPDIPHSRRTIIQDELIDAPSQASFYRSYNGPKVPSRGSSDHSVSSAFEASYEGQFRQDYISTVLAVRFPNGKLPSFLSELILRH